MAVRFVPAPAPPAPGALEVAVRGPLPSSEVAAFRQELDRLLVPGVDILVLDMKDVPHLSSAALAELVAAADALQRRGGLIVLAEASSRVRTVVDAMGLRRLLEMLPAVADARAAAAAHAARLAQAPRLVQLAGGAPVAEFPILAGPVTLGSDPKNTVVLRHHEVEPRHAEVFRVGGEVFVKDLGTRYGTFVGGRRVAEAALGPGADLRVAAFAFTLKPPAGR
jgi:anti-anti-sigma factor